jgi:hypothetical protein
MQLIYPLENQTRFEVIERDSARLPDSLLVSNQSFGRFCRRVYPPRLLAFRGREAPDERSNPRYLVVIHDSVTEELRGAVARSLDAEFLHAVAKRVRMEVQNLRRTLWAINDPAGMLKRG